MKKFGTIAILAMFFGLFFSSCEKEYLNDLDSSGNGPANVLKDGEGDSDSDVGGGDDDDDDTDDGITDGGRDEDYDKSGKPKKPKQ